MIDATDRNDTSTAEDIFFSSEIYASPALVYSLI